MDYRLRRTAQLGPKKTDTAARVAEVVGNSLREIRRSQGHSLDTLAAASGVSRAMLGQIETGKSVPTITVLWKVAAALGVPVAQLITDPDGSSFSVTRRAEAPEVDKAGPTQVRDLVGRDFRGGYLLDEIRISAGHTEIFAPRREGGNASLMVASGSIDITLGDKASVALGEGDAIHFSAGMEHVIANGSTKEAILYLVVGLLKKKT